MINLGIVIAEVVIAILLIGLTVYLKFSLLAGEKMDTKISEIAKSHLAILNIVKENAQDIETLANVLKKGGK